MRKIKKSRENSYINEDKKFMFKIKNFSFQKFSKIGSQYFQYFRYLIRLLNFHTLN